METGTSACPVHCPCPVQSFQGVAVYCTSQTKTMFVYNVMPMILIPRLYGTKCAGCNEGLCPEDLVRRAVNKVYHVRCFLCSLCKKQLSTGEQLYLVQVRYWDGGVGGRILLPLCLHLLLSFVHTISQIDKRDTCNSKHGLFHIRVCQDTCKVSPARFY